MNKMMLKTQATSKIVTKMIGSLEVFSPLIAKAIVDAISDELYAEEVIYKAKRLYSEEIVIAWNLVSLALTKYATDT
jgi:hypothetical protein